MEYVLGSVMTIVCLVVMRKMLMRVVQDPIPKPKAGQSHIYALLKPLIPDEKPRYTKKTQATKLTASLYVRVLIMDNKAYWIKDNAFYVADMEDQEIIKDSTKTVDTMGMDKVELDRMVFIVDQLTKGNQDDSSNSGYPWV